MTLLVSSPSKKKNEVKKRYEKMLKEKVFGLANFFFYFFILEATNIDMTEQDGPNDNITFSRDLGVLSFGHMSGGNGDGEDVNFQVKKDEHKRNQNLKRI